MGDETLVVGRAGGGTNLEETHPIVDVETEQQERELRRQLPDAAATGNLDREGQSAFVQHAVYDSASDLRLVCREVMHCMSTNVRVAGILERNVPTLSSPFRERLC